MNQLDNVEQLSREKFLLALLTDECKTCPKEDLMHWWEWRDMQWEAVEQLEAA
jgi:hypothetical protein